MTSTTPPGRSASTARPSSPVSARCTRRCRTPTWCGRHGCTPATARTSSAPCAGWRQATGPSTWSSTRSGRHLRRRPRRGTVGDRRATDGAAAAARRQRRRGQQVRAGAGGVRGRRSRSRTGATGVQRGRASARGTSAVFGAVRSRRDGCGPGAAAAVAGGVGRGDRKLTAPATLDAVSDELVVVTVTYSPGPHLDRFLATLSHATERPVTVVMADNGSTDGSPEEAARAVPQHPAAAHRRQPRLRHGGEPRGRRAGRVLRPRLFVVANPDVQWGPGSIDALLEAAARWPRAGVARPADPRPRRLGLPVGAAPAQPGPRRHARGGRAGVAVQPVDGGLPAGAARAHRTSGRLAVGIVPVAARRGVRSRSAASTSATSCTWRTSTWAIGSARPAGRTCTCRRRRFCTTRVTPPAATPPATWPRTTGAPTLSWLIGTTSGGRRRCGGR